MKFLKWVAISIGTLIAFFLIVAIFLPAEFRVERSIVINAPIENVYTQVADFKNWEHWMPWLEMERTADYTISNPSIGVDARMSWIGDTVGSGSITVVEDHAPNSIKSKLEFGEGDIISDQIWTFESTPEGTKVLWAIEGEAAYPLMRYMGLMFDSMAGPDFERGLAKLKKFVEGMPGPPAALEDATEVAEDSMAVEQPPVDVR